MNDGAADGPQKPHLRRRLTLPLLVLYGLGVTIGAGIYVLVGATAGRAGLYAPVSFVHRGPGDGVHGSVLCRACRALPGERRGSRLCAGRLPARTFSQWRPGSW